ncbi:MAG TPA: hypothetical protein PKC30_09775 [Saprospiraceae bacterium]|nr:hypothetical protein [Saprospiraceae bacterium]
MVLIGNIFLGLAAIIYILICSELVGKPIPDGDAGVGWAWSILFTHFGLLFCYAIVAGIIGWQGKFEWVASTSSARFWLISLGILIAVLGSMFSLFREGNKVLIFMGNVLPVLIPLLMLAGLAILLNGGSGFKVPLLASAGLGLLPCMLVLFLSLNNIIENRAQLFEENKNFEDRNLQSSLQSIDSCDVMKEMVFILVYTDVHHKPQVRERALTRIRSHPDWQQELIRLLELDWAPQAFTFLASNEVDDPSRFELPVRKGILIQAHLIRKYIQNARGDWDFYPDLFLGDVRRVLKTAERFEKFEFDYKSEVQQIRAALDEPSQYKKPTFLVTKELERWLKKRM